MQPLTTRSIFALCAFAAFALAAILASSQSPFAPSFFDFGHYQSHEGQLSLKPYPVLQTPQGTFPLVAPGKFGAETLLQGMDGAAVSLRASSIRREGTEMLEIEAASVRRVSDYMAPLALFNEVLGSFIFSGEIVDSKCFLGVMNPGAGHVHRECAVRCLSGGVPPLFVVKDSKGKQHFLWLSDPAGEPLSRAILDYVAEPVRISGQLQRRGNLFYFRIDPGSIQRE